MPQDDQQRGPLAAFSSLAASAADSGCNVFNEPELMAWLGDISLDRLGAPLPKKGARSQGPEAGRSAKAAAWLATVARKAMIREGSREPWAPSASELSRAPEWARAANIVGQPLAKLALTAQERSSIESSMDWMMAGAGPSLASDWSKITLAQARASERAWVAALSKAEEKSRDSALADAGETFIAQIAPLDASPEAAGRPWRWVELLSPEALGREGSRMRNCIGKHYTESRPGEEEFFSLRSMDGEPIASVRLTRGRFAEAKIADNELVGAEHAEALSLLVDALTARVHAAGRQVDFASDFEEAGFRSERDGLPPGRISDPAWRGEWMLWAHGHQGHRSIRHDFFDFLQAQHMPEVQSAWPI